MDQQIQLGKYRLFHHLASGGMGEVFLAVNEGPAGFTKTVVVKRILGSVASDPAFVTMFLNEARLAALIEHPNVVQIFELGLEAGTYFIAMEYVHGRSLRHVRHQLVERKRSVAPELAARICSQALQGLHHAHTLTDADGISLQIVHRDVSPDNLLVGFNGVVKVVDFGIAKAAVNVSTTRAGSVKGKYAYMAPEQITGTAIDSRADVYAMGVLLYELLSGTRPFHASSEPGLIRAILNDAVLPPAATNPDIPEALNDIVMRAISRDPTARFANAEAMSLALEGYIQNVGKTVTNAHIGAMMKELFPESAANKTPVPPSPRTAHAISFGLTPAPGSIPPSAQGAQAAHEVEASLPEIEIVMDADDKRSRRRTAWIAGAAGGALLLAGAAIVLPHRINAAVTPSQSASRTPVTTATAASPSTPAAAAPNATTPLNPAVPKATEVAIAPPRPTPEQQRESQPEPETATPSEATAARSSKRTSRERRRESRAQHLADTSTGRVALRVNPWAEVFWSGRSMGVTPMDAVELPAGVQTLTLRNPELKLERKVSVNVRPNREVVLKADLLE